MAYVIKLYSSLGKSKIDIIYESTESEYTDSNNTNDKINHDTDNNVTKVEKQKIKTKLNICWHNRLPHNVDSEYKGDNYVNPPDELWTPRQSLDNFFLTNNFTESLLNKL